MNRLLAFMISFTAILALGEPAVSSTRITADHRTLVVVDGDTIQADGTVWQLYGIDAPELGQVCEHKARPWRCGLAAAYKLRQLTGFRTTPVTCYPKSGAMKRATCLAGDRDISLVLIQSGYAVAVSNGPALYQAAEDRARRAGLGIWGTAFVAPREWRDGVRLHGERVSEGDEGELGFLPRSLSKFLNGGRVKRSECMIKGVWKTARGHLYFGPLDDRYREIEIDIARGDRFFCSDDEAQQAGWHHDGETW